MSTDPSTSEADFRDWYERTSRRLYAYVRRYCAEDDCDDVIAEVYLAAWRHFDELPTDAMPWLIGTARKVMANSWRARGRRQRLAVELANLDRMATTDCAGQAVERTDLLRALARLNADDQEILLLAGWDGLTSAGIATALGCSPVAARARLSRARSRLAGALSTASGATIPLLQLVPEAN